MKRTKTPWKFHDTQDKIYILCQDDDKILGGFGEVYNKENAKFIVKACNENQQLRELLEEAVELMGEFRARGDEVYKEAELESHYYKVRDETFHVLAAYTRDQCDEFIEKAKEVLK